MIYDSLAHIGTYKGVHPRIWRALELLRDTDFADIMMMLSGSERIGVAPLESVTDTGEETQGDIRFYHGRTVPVLLKDDRFAVFFPGDAHAPGVADGTPAAVRKCVMKVKL